MEERTKKPDGFRFTTLFSIVIAVFVMVMTASAAGRYVFTEYDYTNGGEGFFSSFLPLSGEAPEEQGGRAEKRESGRAGEQQSGKAAEEAEGDRVRNAAEAIGTVSAVTDGDVQVTLARFAAKTVGGATGTDIEETYTQAAAAASQVAAETSEKAGRTRALFRAVSGAWSAFFGNAWPFLKGLGTGIWSVFHAGTYYEPQAGQ